MKDKRQAKDMMGIRVAFFILALAMTPPLLAQDTSSRRNPQTNPDAEGFREDRPPPIAATLLQALISTDVSGIQYQVDGPDDGDFGLELYLRTAELGYVLADKRSKSENVDPSVPLMSASFREVPFTVQDAFVCATTTEPATRRTIYAIGRLSDPQPSYFWSERPGECRRMLGIQQWQDARAALDLYFTGYRALAPARGGLRASHVVFARQIDDAWGLGWQNTGSGPMRFSLDDSRGDGPPPITEFVLSSAGGAQPTILAQSTGDASNFRRLQGAIISSPPDTIDACFALRSRDEKAGLSFRRTMRLNGNDYKPIGAWTISLDARAARCGASPTHAASIRRTYLRSWSPRALEALSLTGATIRSISTSGQARVTVRIQDTGRTTLQPVADAVLTIKARPENGGWRVVVADEKIAWSEQLGRGGVFRAFPLPPGVSEVKACLSREVSPGLFGFHSVSRSRSDESKKSGVQTAGQFDVQLALNQPAC